MRKGKIRFPLKLKDDAEARNLQELRENFDLEKIIQYFSDGSLERWLDVWMLTDEAEKVRALDKDDKAIGRKLCELFGVEPLEEAVDAEDIAWRTERENRLKQYTGNKEILAKVDFVAFDTEDLYDILEEEDTDTIYLCNNSFYFNSGVLKHKNKRYIGIGKAEAVIGSKAPMDFEGLGIAFENVKFDEEYEKVKNSFAIDISQHTQKQLSANKTIWSAVKMTENRFRNLVFGKEVSKDITKDNGIVIVRAGTLVTDEVIKDVKLANKSIELASDIYYHCTRIYNQLD